MISVGPGSAVYVDANIFIYFIEGNPLFVEPARAFLSQMDNVGARVITNEITIAECLHRPARGGNLEAIKAYERLFGGDEIELIALDGALAKRAAMLGGALRLKLIDAIHYLSAMERGCEFFVTNDAQFRSGPKLRVLRPFKT